MLTFEEFLNRAAVNGEFVNIVFEQRLFDLVATLHRLSEPLIRENVAHELVGGLAVLLHVEEADPAQSVLTRDIDLMIQRADLARVVEIAERQGFHFRHAAGVDMLVWGSPERAKNAIHLVFAGEKVRATQAIANPDIAPERRQLLGSEVWVIPMLDLLRMKLSANRDKDRVHVRSMDAAGLITPEIEQRLAPELLARLAHIRQTE